MKKKSISGDFPLHFAFLLLPFSSFSSIFSTFYLSFHRFSRLVGLSKNFPVESLWGRCASCDGIKVYVTMDSVMFGATFNLVTHVGVIVQKGNIERGFKKKQNFCLVLKNG